MASQPYDRILAQAARAKRCDGNLALGSPNTNNRVPIR
jgi:hypothetical protein